MFGIFLYDKAKSKKYAYKKVAMIGFIFFQ